MDSFNRLQLIARVTYYLGWIAAVCGGLVHFTSAVAIFRSIALTKRNLFEASMFFFVVAIASALRASIVTNSGTATAMAKKQTA
jgi:hypothetical protein